MEKSVPNGKQSPFYVNMIAAKYGQGMTIIEMSGVLYCGFWNHDNDTIKIVTYFKKFLMYGQESYTHNP